jgi:hypothetical protein
MSAVAIGFYTINFPLRRHLVFGLLTAELLLVIVYSE